jgi:nitric oxide reductase subunit B
MVFLAAMCIGGFYATSLTWGQQTHYAMIEYWRWWLVHLWVEGFFEVFATAVIALLFTRLGLIRAATANSAIILETIVFLFGGILGTLHHLYFTGTPTSVIAIGAMFSALEVVPLAMIGVEAYRNYQRSQGGALGAAPTSGRSCASSPSASGTSSAPACSASRSTRRSRCTTCRE